MKVIASAASAIGGVRPLTSGPAAAVGALVHRALEACARRGETESPERLFEREHERMCEDLRQDPLLAHCVPLSCTRSESEWRRLRAWVVRRGGEVAKVRPRQGPSSSRSRESVVDAGAEVSMCSYELRLRGRADLVKRLGADAFEVRDFKTGSVLTQAGEVRETIALQLRSYGLMLLEAHPRARVRLVVDDGGEHDVKFDEVERKSARDHIRKVTATIPPAGPASAAALATPGADCWGCRIRHMCPAYRASAPGWWAEYPSDIDRIPSDAWGVVSTSEGDGTSSVVLTDDAGRRVRIDGLDRRHGNATDWHSRRVWCFELEGSGPTRGFDGRQFHPRVFHEIPRDRRERRAWSAELFIEWGR